MASGGPIAEMQSLLKKFDAVKEINKKDQNGYTALFEAVKLGKQEVVKLLLDAGAAVDFHLPGSDAALLIAVENNHPEIVKLILTAKPDLKRVCRGHTAILAAVQSNNLMCTELLINAGADVNTKDQDGRVLLTIAYQNGQVDLVSLLIISGADVNQVFNGRTALLFAVDNESLGVVKLLVRAKANLDVMDEEGSFALLNAVSTNQTQMVKVLIDAGADVNLKGRECTPIQVAVEKGYYDITDQLIWAGADINKPNKDGFTPLMVASAAGNSAMVKRLIAAGADIHMDHNGSTALLSATSRKHLDVVEMLMDAGAGFNINDKDGNSALMTAYNNGWIEAVKRAVASGVDVNHEVHGRTCLLCAVEKNDIEIVNLLIKHGANVNAKEPDGRGALMIAYQNGWTDIVRTLINAKADVNQTYCGRTVLMIAVEKGQKDVVNMLIRARADVNMKDNEGRFALMIAYQNGWYDIVEQLIVAKADVNQVYCGRTALMMAVKKHRPDILDTIKLLLRAGANMDVEDQDGNTAILIAAQNGWTDVVKILIAAGADLNRVSRGRTALLHAVEKRYLGIAEALIKSKANVDIKDQDGYSALMIAAMGGITDVVQWLVEAKADLNQVHDGCTAVMYAALKKHRNIVEILVKAGANVNIKDHDSNSILMVSYHFNWLETVKHVIAAGAEVNHLYHGRCALLVAVDKRHIDVVEMLVKRSADMNIKDADGNTALVSAYQHLYDEIKREVETGLESDAKTDYMKMIRIIIAAGADVNHTCRGRAALHFAAELGHDDVLKLLLAGGADINKRSKFGMSALASAASHGHVESCRVLIEGGAQLNDICKGFTALLIAVEGGFTEIVNLLVTAGADFNIKDQNGNSALILASLNGFTEIVSILLKAGAEVEELCRGRTALLYAVEKGRVDVVKLLISVGADVNIKDSHGESALMVGYKDGWIEIVKILIEAGADVTEMYGGRSALLFAVEVGHLDIVQMLISKGADFDIKDQYGNTPLMVGATRGWIDIVRTLINAGADLNQVCRGHTAMTFALERGHVDIVTLLISAGANIIIEDQDGFSALMIASQNGWTDIVKIILKEKVDVNHVNRGRSAVMVAVEKGHEEIVKLLIAAGADLNLKDNDGRFCLVIAAQNGWTSIVRLLIEEKVDLNLVCRGKTTLLYAIEKGNADIVEMLVNAGADINAKDQVHALDFAIRKNRVDLAITLISAGAYHSVIDGVPTVSPLFTQQSLRPYKEYICSKKFLTYAAVTRHNYDIWFLLVQVDVKDVVGIEDIVRDLVNAYPALVNVKDSKGRVAVDIATPEIKFAINSVTLWFGKYRPAKGKPEHTSATCFVVKAMDESKGDPVPVALKLMRIKAQFIRETEARKHGFDGDYVMVTSESYPQQLTDAHADLIEFQDDTNEVLTKAQAESLYCVVMPLADRNMYVAMKSERFAGKENLSEVVTIFTQLVKCVGHMHEKGVVHGDVKPMNMVRMGGKWMMIDLDACCQLKRDPAAFKSSSAYVPPEAVYAHENDGVVAVKSEAICKKYGLTPLIAEESFDIWSLGCILYQMCNKDVLPLFLAGQDDNLNTDQSDAENSLWRLAEWSDKLKEKKLSKIANLEARNLLSLMLNRDPAKRPTLSRVLGHPFLTGENKLGRLPGEHAEYDVFISYRVASDLKHAEILYDMLTDAGLSVWWDKKCLESGKEWQKGFCRGLGSSTAFLCILSQEGTEKPFQALTSESFCDNVLLEHRLALELKRIEYINYVFPIMIGELANALAMGDGERYKLFKSSNDAPRNHVVAVEKSLRQNLNELGLGTPFFNDPSVYDIVGEIRSCNGYYIGGKSHNTFENAVIGIVNTLSASPAAAEVIKNRSALTIRNPTSSPSSARSSLMFRSPTNPHSDHMRSSRSVSSLRNTVIENQLSQAEMVPLELFDTMRAQFESVSRGFIQDVYKANAERDAVIQQRDELLEENEQLKEKIKFLLGSMQ